LLIELSCALGFEQQGLEGEFFSSAVMSWDSIRTVKMMESGWALLASLGRAHQNPLRPPHWPHAREAGQAWLGRFQSEVRLGWLGWAAQKMEKWEL
jgi:hypothetical protein